MDDRVRRHIPKPSRKLNMEQDTLERPAVAEVLQQDPPPFADAIAQGDVEYLSITMESLGTTDPADADVIWTAAVAVADAYGWTTADAIARLAAIDWQPA